MRGEGEREEEEEVARLGRDAGGVSEGEVMDERIRSGLGRE